MICEAARKGCAVLMVSSDLDEVVRMSHRVLVMRDGGICANLESPTQEDILTLAFDHEPVETS
jgi:ABC-type sugar transport system ATPase subunit